MDNTTVEEKAENEHGICMEAGCDKPATKDYNGHNHWVCDRHFDKLWEEFEEDYR